MDNIVNTKLFAVSVPVPYLGCLARPAHVTQGNYISLLCLSDTYREKSNQVTSFFLHYSPLPLIKRPDQQLKNFTEQVPCRSVSHNFVAVTV